MAENTLAGSELLTRARYQCGYVFFLGKQTKADLGAAWRAVGDFDFSRPTAPERHRNGQERHALGLCLDNTVFHLHCRVDTVAPDYVSRFFDVIPVAEMKRAYLGLGGLVTFAALSSGMARQEGFMPIAQFVASASGIFVLPDWLAAVRSHRRSRRKG